MIRSRLFSASALEKIIKGPAFGLGLVALDSALIYLRGLVQPYGLLQWWRLTYVTVGNMIGRDPGPDHAYMLVFAALFVLYIVALWIVRTWHDWRLWTLVIIGAAAFNLIMLFQYPFDALDIFDNIIRGRMLGLYHANPFYSVPYQFPGDLFYPYALWIYSTSAYGPLWEMTAAVTAAMAGNSVIVNVIAFKLVGIAGYAVTGLVIALTLRRQSPEHALFGVALFTWNPLVISSIAGNGHNDSVMAVFVVMGFYFLAVGRFTLAALAETVGALIKFIPALLLPIVVMAALRSLPDWRARLRYLALTVPACGLLVVGAYLPYWHGRDILGLSRRTTLFTTSIPALVHFFLSQSIGDRADKMVAYGALAVTGLWVVWQTWRVSRDSAPDAPARAGLAVLLFYLLITCLWFQPWYVVWVMALAPLVLSQVAEWGSILLSAAAHAQLPLFYLILYRHQEQYPPPLSEVVEVGATLGLCWVYFVAAGIVQLVSRYRDRARPTGNAPPG
jgi:hypothetical protein